MNQKAIDQTRILTRSEVARVLADLRQKGKRSVNQRANLVLFRLSTCCGLRLSEICGLTLANVFTSGERPHLALPKHICKNRKSRKVPLWLDGGTLADLTAWKQERMAMGAKPGDAFVCCLNKGARYGKPMFRTNAQKRWRHAIKALGAERVGGLSIHAGRHTFCSHMVGAGVPLHRIRDAAGHSNISTTSLYLHTTEDDSEPIGNVW